MSGYNRRLVEHLLPAVYDEGAAYGIRNPYAPDPDMPRGSGNKKEGSPLSAHLADIRSAWRKAEVPQVQRQVVLLYFMLGMKQREISELLGFRQQSVSYHLDAGVGRITAWLNGETYKDGYDGSEEDVSTDIVC